MLRETLWRALLWFPNYTTVIRPVISGIGTDCTAHLIGADFCSLIGNKVPSDLSLYAPTVQASNPTKAGRKGKEIYINRDIGDNTKQCYFLSQSRGRVTKTVERLSPSLETWQDHRDPLCLRIDSVFFFLFASFTWISIAFWGLWE